MVIPHYRRPDLLAACLDALERQTFRDFEVVVADDGSQDGSAETARARGARVVELPENRGFAAAANAGLAAARGEWLVLLNNDAFPEPGFLAALAAAAERRPEAGMFACRVLFEQEPGRIDNLGHQLYWDGLNRGRARMLRADDPAWLGEQEVFFPSGCAGAYRCDLLAEVGLFEEWFHSYGEDADLGLRCRRAGASCRYVPEAVVHHRFSASGGAHSARKAYLVERNRIGVLVRNLPWPLVLLSPPTTLWRLLLHLVAALLGKGSAGEGSRSTGPFRLALAQLSAWGSALAALPRLLADRRRILRGGRLGTLAMLRLCLRFRVSAWTLAFGRQAPLICAASQSRPRAGPVPPGGP